MNWHTFYRGPLREGEPGAPGSGTGQPGGPIPTPGTGTGTGEQPKFVTEETFGKTAALIGGIKKAVDSFASSAVTLDRLAEIGILEKAEEDGKPVYRAKAAAPPTRTPKPEDDPLLARVKNLEGQLDKAKQEKLDADRRVEETERNRQVMAALDKAGAVKADRDFVHVVPRLIKNSEGAWIVPGKDQHGFDKEWTLEEYADLFLKENPELRKAQGQAGSGTPTGAGTGGAVNGKQVIPKSTWSQGTWFSANHDKIVKGEVLLGD